MKKLIFYAAFVLIASPLLRAQQITPANLPVASSVNSSDSFIDEQADGSSPTGYTTRKVTAAQLQAFTLSGSGSVTSVSAGNLSPLFNSAVGTSTTTPALSFSLVNQSPNAFFAGPASGSTSGAPTFRALAAADIPALPYDAAGSAAAAQAASQPLNAATTLQGNASVTGIVYRNGTASTDAPATTANVQALLPGAVITGTTDTIQQKIVANSTQTNPIVQVTNSSGTTLFQIDNSGNLTYGGALTGTIEQRTGTQAAIASTVLGAGEGAFTTDTKNYYIGDGTTTGGNFIGGTYGFSVKGSLPIPGANLGGSGAVGLSGYTAYDNQLLIKGGNDGANSASGTGAGGMGGNAGANTGLISPIEIIGGNGGAADGNFNGGIGGSAGLLYPPIDIAGGNGGAASATAAGGNGGTHSAFTPVISMVAGTGGAGSSTGTGAGGAGGSMGALFANGGNGTAGSGNTAGTTGGSGGSVNVSANGIYAGGSIVANSNGSWAAGSLNLQAGGTITASGNTGEITENDVMKAVTTATSYNSNGANETDYDIATPESSVTITLPTGSHAGQIVRYATGATITAITMAGGTVDIGAAPTSAVAGDVFMWTSDSYGHWIRMQ